VPSAFISYSWDDDFHRQWVLDLATRLRGDGVETVLDQWHVVPGDQLPAFMEKSIRDSDYVLTICTPRYKEKSDQRKGGVGYEGDIITAEVFSDRNQRKFIPVLRQGEWSSAAPTWLKGKYHVDLRGAPYQENHYQDLLTTLLGTRRPAPPVRAVSPPASAPPGGSNQPARVSAEFQPIRIEGVIVDEITVPRGDGSAGSALYAIPFRLNRRPPAEWADFFIEGWNRPSTFTSMHRPGIAHVYDDKVILDGTTVEEVERYHRGTLLLAADAANKSYAQLIASRQIEQARERQMIEAHKASVSDAAKKLKF
jgi:hypothetical protein